ncbi:MAG: hypothetical protein IK020_02515 [Clostridiales bacterium]|nr:hypothetical protein [Clostridiales bacterium]
MRKLECTGCGANLQWNGEDKIVTCVSCGSQFLMHVAPRSPGDDLASRIKEAHVGGDMRDRLDGEGNSTFISYLPEGWNYTIDTPQDYGLNRLTPLTVRIDMASPDDTCCIAYISQNGYMHIPPMPMNMSSQNQVHPIELVRMRSFMSASEYCDYMVRRWTPFAPTAVAAESGEDEITLKWRQDALKTIDRNTLDAAVFDYKKRIYHVEYQGTRYFLQTETEVYTNRAVPNIWCTNYEMYVYAPEMMWKSVLEEYEKVKRTIRLGRDYPRFRQMAEEMLRQKYMECQNIAANGMMNIAMARQQSAMRQSQIIADTNAYTTGVARQMMQDNAASHQRSANMFSEMIRGENAYRGTDGKVYTASTRWDHVYQGGHTGDTFVMTEGEFLRPGVDFEELGKIDKGDY